MHRESYPRCPPGSTCTYCGSIADTMDHVIPYCINGNKTELVPACRECNILLSSFVFRDIQKRREWIIRRLRDRYKSDLKMRAWSKEEIEATHGPLKASIIQSLNNKHDVSMRIAWARKRL